VPGNHGSTYPETIQWKHWSATKWTPIGTDRANAAATVVFPAPGGPVMTRMDTRFSSYSTRQELGTGSEAHRVKLALGQDSNGCGPPGLSYHPATRRGAGPLGARARRQWGWREAAGFEPDRAVARASHLRVE